MKLETCNETRTRGQEVVARFGKAALIRLPDETWQLKGGTQDDQLSAREWISLFLHEAVVNPG